MSPGPPGRTVLVVDDDESLRMLCRVNLELEGYRVLEAATLATARTALSSEPVEVLLLDLHLPGEDGRELLREVRARSPAPAVALFTGSPELEDGAQGEAADAVLRKPFALEELVVTVRRLTGPRGRVGAVPATTVRTPAEFESRLQRFLLERSEEARAVAVGEKEVSEQAEIVARYADLFTRDQLEALREAEQAAAEEERERLYRLRKACESGVIVAELAEQQDALENALLGTRVEFRGESLTLRTAQTRLALLPSYIDREELGTLHGDRSAEFNDERLALVRAGEELAAELSGEPDPVARSEEDKGISLRQLAEVVADASALAEDAYAGLRERWFERLLGPEREPLPSSYHLSYLRRLSPLAETYTKERATEVCLDTLKDIGFDLAAAPNIRTDLEDRPQKTPRACVIASDPPEIVHLITRAQGGLHDYQAFLHEAGHALHYAGCDPALPYTFRRLSRDHALTEIYSYICEAITRGPEWHARHFGLSDERAAENAEATIFLEALLFRRYVAKLQFELDFWARFHDDGGTPHGYAERLTQATGLRYRADGFLADMDPGFYSADYLRAWVRCAQLRAHLIVELGEDWWRRPETGELLRSLFAEGTRPTSEEVAERLGFNPLDVRPLLAELGASSALREC